MQALHTEKTARTDAATGHDDLTEALREANEDIVALRLRLSEYEWVESALQARTRELSERVKELECLFLISHCLCRCDLNTDGLMQRIVEELPKGFQYPRQTWVRLNWSGRVFCSRDFQQTPHFCGVDMMIQGKPAGALRVFVKPPVGPGIAPPILPMEKSLVETVGLWIENTMAHWQETIPHRPAARWWERLKTAIGRNHGGPNRLS